MRDTIHDVESYPNFFCCGFKDAGVPGVVQFEISSRRNDLAAFRAYVTSLERMVGFNNEFYDYPVIHFVMETDFSGMNGAEISYAIYEFSSSVIRAASPWDCVIWDRYRYVPQLDLYKIWHFDNPARRTSLKALQIAMRSPSVEDLPFVPGTYLTPEQMDVTLLYNGHDIEETERFYWHSRDKIEFRETLGSRELNYNDTKIGKKFVERELERRAPGITKNPDGSKRQTPREYVPIGEIVFPYIQFRSDTFRSFLDWFRTQSVPAWGIKGFFKKVCVEYEGFSYQFGAGGLHASVSRTRLIADDEWKIEDVDVTSFYPSLSIVNRIAPAHLGELYCDINGELKVRRRQYEKGTSENKTLKLALNGTYGDSNNKYSVFYDPAFTLATTVNGQLLLCLLCETLTRIEGLSIIQANTDGITMRYRRRDEPLVREICEWWERFTCLDLERVEYRRMFVRDVNNYIADPVEGKPKRKGAYEYDHVGNEEWNKDPSMLVVPKAAEAALLRDADVREFVYTHDDPWDFLIRAKVPRTSRLLWGNESIQKTSRYYVATQGKQLTKIMPPLPGKDEERLIVQNVKIPGDTYHRPVGHPTIVCNRFDGHAPYLDREFYVAEAEKLIDLR